MNVQNKSQVSGVLKKIVLAVALVVGGLVILSGVLMNRVKNITVQARTGGVIARQESSSLPVSGLLQPQFSSALPALSQTKGLFDALTHELAQPRVVSAPSALSQANVPSDPLALEHAIPQFSNALPALSQTKGLYDAMALEFALP